MKLEQIVLVSVRKVAETYPRGFEWHQKYCLARELAKEGKDSEDIGQELGIDYETVKHWITKENKPYSVSAVEKLQKQGLLPSEANPDNFTYRHDLFRAVNRIAANVYWSGTNSQSRVVTIVVTKNTNMSQLEKDLDTVGLDFKKVDRKSKLIQIEDVTAFSKFLYALGIPRGKKTRNKDFKIPDYVMDLCYLASDGLLGNEDTEATKEIIKDFLDPLLRNLYCTPRRTRLHLPSNYSQETAIKSGENVLKLLEYVTSYKFTELPIRIAKARTGSYFPYVYFPAKTARALSCLPFIERYFGKRH